MGNSFYCLTIKKEEKNCAQMTPRKRKIYMAHVGDIRKTRRKDIHESVNCLFTGIARAINLMFFNTFIYFVSWLFTAL